MRCPTWITLWFLSQSDSFSSISSITPLSLASSFHHTFGTHPASAGSPHRSITIYLLWLRRTASPTHLQKTPGVSRGSNSHWPARPTLRTSLATVLKVPPSWPLRIQQPWDHPSSRKRRERPSLCLRGKHAMLARELAVAEEPSRGAPGRFLLARCTVGAAARPPALGPALHPAPPSGKALGQPASQAS